MSMNALMNGSPVEVARRASQFDEETHATALERLRALTA